MIGSFFVSGRKRMGSFCPFLWSHARCRRYVIARDRHAIPASVNRRCDRAVAETPGRPAEWKANTPTTPHLSRHLLKKDMEENLLPRAQQPTTNGKTRRLTAQVFPFSPSVSRRVSTYYTAIRSQTRSGLLLWSILLWICIYLIWSLHFTGVCCYITHFGWLLAG